jgi:hypothetical protein
MLVKAADRFKQRPAHHKARAAAPARKPGHGIIDLWMFIWELSMSYML